MDLEPAPPLAPDVAKSKPTLWIGFTAVMTIGLVLATHLVPSLATTIGATLQSVTGLETVTFQAQNERNALNKHNELLEAELADATATVASVEAELIDQKAQTTAAQRELSEAFAAITALQIAVQAEQDTNQVALAALQTSISDDQEELKRLAALRTRTIQTIYSARGRIKRMAASNVGATLGESIPIFGIGVIVAGTTYEMTESCTAMDEMTALLELLEPAEGDLEEEESHTKVCGLELPTKEEIWRDVKASPGAAWDASKSAIGNAADWAHEIEGPDLSRIEAWFRHVF